MLAILSIVVLGLTAGALLTEGAVLVTFWRSLPPEPFLAWYRENAHILLRFFAPLEILAALLATLAVIATSMATGSPAPLLVASSLLSLLVLAAFPLYFKSANSSFAEGTIEAAKVEDELKRWARWHWLRVTIATAAFLAALLARLPVCAVPPI